MAKFRQHRGGYKESVAKVNQVEGVVPGRTWVPNAEYPATFVLGPPLMDVRCATNTLTIAEGYVDKICLVVDGKPITWPFDVWHRLGMEHLKENSSPIDIEHKEPMTPCCCCCWGHL